MLIAAGVACVVASAQAQGVGSASAGGGYQFRAVDFPGAANTAVYAVNDRGQFVGAEKDIDGSHHAIVDDGTHLRLLDPNGLIGTSPESWAFSINNRDDIAGAYTDTSGAHHGYVHHADGTITHIEFPGAIETQAYGVNDLRTVIGVYTDTDGNVRAFTLHNGHYRNIDLPGGTPSFGTTPLSINDFGEIVGEFIRTENTNGFGYLQKPDGRFTLTTAPGSAPEQTYFISINNRQQILGAFADSAGAQHNFLKTGQDFRPFDLPARFAASFVSAQTVNDRDEIVGWYLDASNVAHGFVAIPARR
jgi:probable HAF family extracellular repeat protein